MFQAHSRLFNSPEIPPKKWETPLQEQLPQFGTFPTLFLMGHKAFFSDMMATRSPTAAWPKGNALGLVPTTIRDLGTSGKRKKQTKPFSSPLTRRLQNADSSWQRALLATSPLIAKGAKSKLLPDHGISTAHAGREQSLELHPEQAPHARSSPASNSTVHVQLPLTEWKQDSIPAMEMVHYPCRGTAGTSAPAQRGHTSPRSRPAHQARGQTALGLSKHRGSPAKGVLIMSNL